MFCSNYCILKNISPGEEFCCSDCGGLAWLVVWLADKHLENCPTFLSVLARSPGSWDRSDLPGIVRDYSQTFRYLGLIFLILLCSNCSNDI